MLWEKKVKVKEMTAKNGFLLSGSKIAIIGLGLMGGSLALALRGWCAGVYGIDSDLEVIKLALHERIVDHASDDPAKFLPGVNMVILATPIPSILDLLQQLPDFTPNPCIVLDLGSTKRLIVDSMSHLPDRFDPIGGHPLCGREKLSLANADGNLFRDAPFLLTPLKRTSARALSAARQIISAIGAAEITVDAVKHDRSLASTSHLPFLLSSALVLSTPQADAPFIGSGFRSNSRLAATPASMMSGILESNRDNVLESLGHFRSALDEIEAALRSNDAEQLDGILQKAANHYHLLVPTQG